MNSKIAQLLVCIYLLTFLPFVLAFPLSSVPIPLLFFSLWAVCLSVPLLLFSITSCTLIFLSRVSEVNQAEHWPRVQVCDRIHLIERHHRELSAGLHSRSPTSGHLHWLSFCILCWICVNERHFLQQPPFPVPRGNPNHLNSFEGPQRDCCGKEGEGKLSHKFFLPSVCKKSMMSWKS